MPSEPLKPPTRDDVEIVETRLIAENYGRLLNYRLRHRRFDGGWSGEISRDCFDSGPAVMVLPYDPYKDEVVLVKQFRTGPWVVGEDPWIYECVAGRIDKAMTAEEIAHAEGREEAGLTFSALERVGRFFTSPGIFSETLETYCGCITGGAKAGLFGLDKEHEDIRAEIFSADEAIAMAISGQIVSGPALVALLWFAHEREALRERWTGGKSR